MSEHFALVVTLDAPAEEVYHAIADADGPRNWWTRFARGSDRVGGVLEFRFPQAGFFAAMRVRTLDPPRRVCWDCIEQVHNADTGWGDLHDWEGTTVRFDIEPCGDNASILRFEHVGLAPVLECFEACDSAWRYYLGQSLKAYVETGQGTPFDDDTQDNIVRRDTTAQ